MAAYAAAVLFVPGAGSPFIAARRSAMPPAVTLRVYLPLALAADVAYADAYRAIAWLCWVPNILVAEWIVHRTRAPVAVATV